MLARADSCSCAWRIVAMMANKQAMTSARSSTICEVQREVLWALVVREVVVLKSAEATGRDRSK